MSANGRLVYAKDVRVQDVLGYVVNGSIKTGEVVSVATSLQRGLYNPYTLSGSIVVDGVVASCHSSWILDGLLPPRVAAEVYQRLFVVPRLAYRRESWPPGATAGRQMRHMIPSCHGWSANDS